MRFKRLYTIEEERQLVAYLYAGGRSNKEIAALLQSTETRVSRRLKEAREAGFVIICPNVPEEIIRRFEPFEGAKQLEAVLKQAIGTSRVKEVIVVPPQRFTEGQRRAGSPDWLADAAARRLWYHAQQGKITSVGLSWGRTLRAVARAAGRVAPPVERARVGAGITWIPVLGDLLHPAEEEAYSLSSSTLAADFTKAFGGEAESSLALYIPAYIPGKFLEKLPKKEREQRQAIIHDFITMLPNYRLIFGPTDNGQQPLMEQLDALVTSVGAPPAPDTKQPWWSLTQQLMEGEEAQVQRATVGNLAGQFITDEEVDPEDARGIEEINARVFGPKIEDFKRLAKNSKAKKSPGLLVVAAGTFKARVVHRISLAGLVGELIIDQALAMELLRLMDHEEQARELQERFGWDQDPEQLCLPLSQNAAPFHGGGRNEQQEPPPSAASKEL